MPVVDIAATLQFRNDCARSCNGTLSSSFVGYVNLWLRIRSLLYTRIFSRSQQEPSMSNSFHHVPGTGGFFIFIFYIFVFYKNIFSIWKFTGIYHGRPAAGRPVPAARQRGGRGISEKKFAEKIARRSLGAGRPAAGRPALAARLQGDRISHPYIRVGWSPHPSFASLKFQKPRKKREGQRRSPAGFSSRRLQVTKILLRFTNRLCCNFC